MKSPRFDIRAAELQSIFSPSNLEKVWKKKVRLSLRDQHLPDPIENLDFHLRSKEACKRLSARILSGEYAPAPSQRILLEKTKGLCRQIVIPSTEDALVLQCLSDALYAEIRGKAPTEKAFFEPEDHTFSKNKLADGYGSYWAWMNYQKELFKFSATREFIVVTDISNYYDSINYVHLRNAIAGVSGVSECVLDMLIYVLSNLLWQPDYMPRTEIGLPQIDLDAPRLLAHCFLYELDSYLQSTPTGDFARYMDDIDVGVDSIADAKRVIRDIDLTLQTRQLRLNGGKTRILSKSEAALHFRVDDNIKVDELAAQVDAHVGAGTDPAQPRATIQKWINDGVRSDVFDGGNGDKILKRLLTLSTRAEAKVSNQALRRILRLRPNLREPVYRYISRNSLSPGRMNALVELIHSGLLVDDASYMNMIERLLDASATRSKFLQSRLDSIVEGVQDRGFYGMHAALWALSKYGSREQMLSLIVEKQQLWSGDPRLGRLVGGLTPLFTGKPEEEDFISALTRSGNSGARDAHRFHSSLQKSLKSIAEIKPQLLASNTSKPTGINHAKFLCLLSVLRNPHLTVPEKESILQANKKAWSDSYYRKLAKECGAGVLP